MVHRIYKVTHLKKLIDAQQETLVHADTRGNALRHVAERCLSVELASQFDLIRLTRAGVKVETARAMPEEAPTENVRESGDKSIWPK